MLRLALVVKAEVLACYFAGDLGKAGKGEIQTGPLP